MTDNRQASGPGMGAGSDTGSRLPYWRAAYVVGGVILAFCAIVFYLTTTFEEVPAALGQGVPPTQFPRLLVAIMVVLTGVMLYETRNLPAKRRKPVPGMVYATAALLTAAIVAIHWVGIIAALMAVCVLMPLLWGERRFVSLAVYAVLFPLLTFLLFYGVLEVRFPKGLVEVLFY